MPHSACNRFQKRTLGRFWSHLGQHPEKDVFKPGQRRISLFFLGNRPLFRGRPVAGLGVSATETLFGMSIADGDSIHTPPPHMHGVQR